MRRADRIAALLLEVATLRARTRVENRMRPVARPIAHSAFSSGALRKDVRPIAISTRYKKNT